MTVDTRLHPRCDATVAWTALRGHFEAHGRDLDLRQMFVDDPARFERFSLQAPEVFADLSKNLWDEVTQCFTNSFEPVGGDHATANNTMLDHCQSSARSSLDRSSCHRH